MCLFGETADIDFTSIFKRYYFKADITGGCLFEGTADVDFTFILMLIIQVQ